MLSADVRPTEDSTRGSGLTLAALAASKGLPVEFLASLGLIDDVLGAVA